MSKLLIALAIFVLVGCSNKAVYDNTRLHLRNECHKQQLSPSGYQKCLERADKTYEEYQREREEALAR